MSDEHSSGNPPPLKFYCLRKDPCECPKGNHTYRKYDTSTLPWLQYRQTRREYEDEDDKERREQGKETKREQRRAREANWQEERKAGENVFSVFVRRLGNVIEREKEHWAEHVRKTELKWKGHESHHCVCCRSVEPLLAERKDIKPIIDQTEWCVNQEANIVTLPLWGHTFRWYCTQSGEVRDIDQMEEKLGRLWEPKFKDRVMHNSDHDIYQEDELNPRLKEIADQVKKNKNNHEKCKEELVTQLNNLVKEFADKVRERGKRETSEGTGTHAGWKAGLNGDKNWFMPFSMAEKPRKRTFPLKGAKGEKLLKLKEYVNKIWGIIR